MFLFELFSGPTHAFEYDAQEFENTFELADVTAAYGFTAGKLSYAVFFMRSRNGQYVCTFGLVKKRLRFGRTEHWLDHDITGTGRAIEVYSNVIAICRRFLTEYKPQMIEFSGFQNKQHELYKKLARYFEKDVAPYHFEFDYGYSSATVLVKNKE